MFGIWTDITRRSGEWRRLTSSYRSKNGEIMSPTMTQLQKLKVLKIFKSFLRSLSRFFFGENDQEPRCDNEGCIFFQYRSGMIEFPSENDEASGKNSVERRERETNEK